MIEILFVVVTLISLLLVLAALRLGTHFVVGLVVALLLTANLFASKLTIVFGVTSSLAIPLYAAIFLATDALTEHHGERAAYKAIWSGLIAQVCLIAFSQLAIRTGHLDTPNVASFSEALSVVFGYVPRIVVGSFIAYLISMNLDVYLYGRLKRRYKDRHLWLRNCVTTPISQAVDSTIFIFIAFYGVLPNLVSFIFSVWLVKVCVAIIDTPFIYLTFPLLGKEYPGYRRASVPTD